MKLYYRVTGHGRALILLHGLFGSGDNWYTLSKSFGEQFRTYTIDQRNHGRSPHSEVFNYEVMAEDLNELMADHDIESASILGHSMGGKTAMQFAAMYPGKVDRLIVVDIALRQYPPGHDKIFEAIFRLDLRKYKTRSELEAALAPEISDLAVRQLLLKNVERDENKRFRWKIDIDAIYQNYENVNAVITLKTSFERPTLFIRGGKSTYISPSDLEEIRRFFPLEEVVTIDGAGHWVHADAPAEFSKAVMEFLSR